MSYTTITQSTRDPELADRINAAIAKEAWANATIGQTQAGKMVHQLGPSQLLISLIWVCCVDFEASYEYAIGVGNTYPGRDPGVITDANIQAAVQAHWPADPVLP